MKRPFQACYACANSDKVKVAILTLGVKVKVDSISKTMPCRTTILNTSIVYDKNFSNKSTLTYSTKVKVKAVMTK